MLLLTAVVFGALCVYLFASYKSSRLLSDIPSHKLSPFPFFIERLYTIFKLGISNAEERLNDITAICLQFSDMAKVWYGPLLVVFICHPKRIQQILSSPKCAEKWNLFYGLVGRETALTFARTTLNYKQHRKFFNPCFSLPAQQKFVENFAENGEALCEMLEREISGKEFDFHLYAKKFCFDIVCEAMVDMKIKNLFDGDGPNYENIFTAFEITEEAFAHKTLIPFLYPATLYKLTKFRREEKKAQQILREFRQYIMQRRTSMMDANGSIGDSCTDGRCVLMDHVIRNENKFADKEIQDHFENFLAAYEILGNEMAHTILLLAMHPDVQEKLYQYIENSILYDGDVANSGIVMRMEYLDAVIREASRLMPAIPIILREVADDFEIEPGLILPKGSKLVMNLLALHRRKDIWGNDSEEFKPERWLAEDSGNRHLFSFLPFSAGSRICIGNRFSTMALKVSTIQILRKFKLSTSMTMKDIRLKSFISMKLCTEHWISLESRDFL